MPTPASFSPPGQTRRGSGQRKDSLSSPPETARRINQQINLAPQGAAGATVARAAPSVLPPAAAEPDVETGTPGTPEAATGPVAGALMLLGPISSVLNGVSP